MKTLRVDGLTAQRDGHVLLDHIRCEVPNGKVVGFLSDNPERLNLLLSILCGVEKEQSGRIRYAEKDWSPRQRILGVGEARESGALVDSLSVLDNLFLSSSKVGTWWGFIRRSERRARAKAVLRRLETQVPLDVELRLVEPNTKVILDVARVLLQDAPYMVFNRITRSLSLRQFHAFQAVIQSLKAAGKGVIVVPLHADDVRSLVDKLYFLQGTQLFEIENFQSLTDQQVQGFFLGQLEKRFAGTNDPIQKAKMLIQERVDAESLDFQELADTVAMSYDNFRRRFKAQTGSSPNQYFLSVKVEKAKELLLYTDLEIKDIAAQLGFSDPYYFSRVFKERTEVSPLHFRKGELETTEKSHFPILSGLSAKK